MTVTAPRVGAGELVARGVVRTVHAGRARRVALSSGALVLTLIIGIGYLLFGALGADPTASTMTVRVHLADSGGLLTGRGVSLRGVPIGKVDALELTDTGLVAVATIDAETRLPADTEVRVAGLSMAGEQYLDFRPQRDGGPYLTDGAEIEVGRTSTPTPLWKTLSTLDTTLAQVNPADLEAIVAELGVSPQGPAKLADIVDSGIFLVSTLDSVLPQTVSLIRDSRTLLATVDDLGPGLRKFAGNANSFLGGVEAKTGGYVELLGAAPGTLRAFDAVLAENSGNAADLLTNLAVVADTTSKRVPALQEFFFPTGRAGSALDGLSVAFHDGGIWGLVNLYPRYTCDYDLPRRPPSRPDYPEPFLYTYCPNNDPSVLIRGASNAPRPPGEAIPGIPPSGARPDAQTTQSPVGPMSLPLTYGRPPLPAAPPAPQR
ncbi:MlaD family protein [Nocardia bovistercoris]|uniref:MCE family protein n=1 Tax=Nocardia bovistercoris TaxID=2785916 RepID=A0A931IBS7_9NOCA|nr:MlaD family protein [Nocardia bovistercoris]MBH0778479.1 MCE family protein [Nocardia bovistercoris]